MKLNITESLADPSIESKIELVTYLIGRLKENQSNRIFESEIVSFIKKKEKKSKTNKYHQIIGPNEALGCLVADFLFNLLTIGDFSLQAKCLGQLLEQINAFGDSPNELIKKSTVDKLIKILIQWGIEPAFIDRYNRTLKIYLVPHENKDVNAYYYAGLNGITLFKSKIGYEEFIFFHEVGHMVGHWITGDPEKVPASFIEFSKKLRPGREEDYVELFADLFSVAVMKGTSVAPKNPAFHSLTADEQKQIKNYFTQLINTEVTIGRLIMASFNFK